MIRASRERGAGFFRRLGAADWVFLSFLLLVWPGVSWLLFPSGDDAITTLSDIPRNLVYLQSIAITASVFLLLAVVLRFRQAAFVDLGYRDFTAANIGFGILLLVAANAILLFLGTVLPSLEPSSDDFIYLLLPRTAGERLLWLGLSLTAAIGEETLFRGYVMTRLRRLFGGWTPAVIISALAFGLAHLYQGWSGVLLTGLYGLIFSLVYLKRQSLWPCIVAHFLQDALALLPLGFPSS